MRLTHTQLKQIIKEEIQKTLNESNVKSVVDDFLSNKDRAEQWLKTVDVQFREWGEGKNSKLIPSKYETWTAQDFKSARKQINSELKKLGYEF